ncbi:MAG: SPOR domain-containing protein [Bacteroidales bacterium]|nr:SPOR domain-containing protein [Bacteroidales bacterium]
MKKLIPFLLSVVMLMALNSCDFLGLSSDKEKKETKKEVKKEDAQKAQPKKVEKEKPKPIEKQPTEKEHQQMAQDKYFLIMESFKVPENAVAYNKKLKEEGFESQIIKRDNGFHCVSYKSFLDKRKAIQALKQDRQDTARSDVWIVKKEGA